MLKTRTIKILVAVTVLSYTGLLVFYQSLKNSQETLSIRTSLVKPSRMFNSFQQRNIISKPSHLDKRLPRALIIGFSKCGTTALRTFLTLHPAIVSPIEEVRYFNYNYSKGLEWYRQQMPLSTERQITVEKTPSYIMSDETLERIYAYDNRIKLIIIVRDPIIRLQSQYAHAFRNNMEKQDQGPAFEMWCKDRREFDRISHFSNYTKFIRPVYNRFPRHQILVLNEGALEQNPLVVMNKLENFLHLRSAFSKDTFYFSTEKGFYCLNITSRLFLRARKIKKVKSSTGCLGSPKGRHHPDITTDFMDELVKKVRPHNKELFQLIGQTFLWIGFEKDKN